MPLPHKICLNYRRKSGKEITENYERLFKDDKEAVIYAYDHLPLNGSIEITRHWYGEGRDHFYIHLSSSCGCIVDKKKKKRK